jgi:hypothetical protein
MKKVILITLALLLGVAAIGFPVYAQTASEPEETVIARRSLTLKAPATGTTGEKLLMTVFDRLTGEKVPGAGVWAVNCDKAGEIGPVLSSSSAISEIGIFLGKTDNNGELAQIFKLEGFYLLVTFKDTYLPGFAWTDIKAVKQLAIKAPDATPAGELVTVMIYERNSGTPVPGAGVWALSPDLLSGASNTEDIVPYLNTNGLFLGWTNNSGQVSHKFETPGRFILVTTKDSYLPGFKKMVITNDLKALVIRAPEVVKVLDPVKIQVVEKSVLTVEIPVPRAAVWAVGINDVAAGIDGTSDSAALAQKYGMLLGYTDEQGYVSPLPHFNRPGYYYLIATKEGYSSALGKIQVMPLPTATAVPVPQTSSKMVPRTGVVTSNTYPAE